MMMLSGITSTPEDGIIRATFINEIKDGSMVYNVTLQETYRYTLNIECADENELSRIIHEDISLLVDMDKDEIERLREQGLQLKCDYSW